MKKKKKFRAKWFLVVLIGAAALGYLAYTKGFKNTYPKASWRVPIQAAQNMDWPKVPGDLSLPSASDLPDIGMRDLYLLRDGVLDKLEDKVGEIQKALPKEEVYPEQDVPPVIQKEKGDAPRAQGEGSRIAVIIDDMGGSPSASKRAASLPPHVTLSYLPYVADIQRQVDEAKMAGHEILLHLPMEPLGGVQPSRDSLLLSQGIEGWKAVLEKNFNAFQGYVGVNNHMGSKFTLNKEGMEVVSQFLLEKGLFFIDSRTSAKSVAFDVACATGVRSAKREVFLDDTQSSEAVWQEIRRLEKVAQSKGQAIAIGHPHSVTLQALAAWIPDAQARGFRFVPVSDLLQACESQTKN